MSIDFNDFKIHFKKSGQKLKKFHCICDKCGKDRGYIPKARADQLCFDCTINTDEFKIKRAAAIKKVRSTIESRMKTIAAFDKKYAEARIKNKEAREFRDNRKKNNPSWWHNDEWRNKQRISHLGKIPGNKGKSLTMEQKIKQSCSKRKISLKEFSGFATPDDRKQRDLFKSQKLHVQRYRIDHFECQICFSKSKLHAHHLNNWKDFIEQRFNVDNLITLCIKCHKKFHEMFGIKNNIREQFEEFKKIILENKDEKK